MAMLKYSLVVLAMIIPSAWAGEYQDRADAIIDQLEEFTDQAVRNLPRDTAERAVGAVRSAIDFLFGDLLFYPTAAAPGVDRH